MNINEAGEIISPGKPGSRENLTPEPKSPAIEQFLTKLSGDTRQEAAEQSRCINPPIGCGKPITGFKDELSIREYKLSGFCQDCQDAYFTE